MTNNIILVGNPNTGKTTLFNTLTKSNQKASNWHGVTVGTVSKNYKFEGEEFCVTDIPGMYSVNGYSNEEKIAGDYLKAHKGDLIVNICDANNLKRNLILTSELISQGLKIVLAVNMSNEVAHNYKLLAELLGVPLLEIDARKTKSVNNLKKLIFDLLNSEKVSGKNVDIISKQNSHKVLDIEKIYESIKAKDPDGIKFTKKLDKILLNKFVFFPVFLIVIFGIFFITFGPIGEFFQSLFELAIEKLTDVLGYLLQNLNINVAVRSFLIDGLLNATATVLSFVPQIVLLMMLLNLLEDTGFMSRVAFMFDGVLKKVGLTGKSLFSLMMGFGCTTSAVLTTRNLENKNLRKRTALLLPFMTCTAKLPIFLVVSSLFFERYKFLFVFLLYIFAILISLVFACIYKKFIPEKSDVLIIEMPKYRFPNFKKIVKDTLTVIADFLVKVGTIILLLTTLIWVLQNFSTNFEFLNGENFDKSILYYFSSKLTFIFKFIGIESAGAVAAIIFGLVAKELVVVGLCMFNGTAGSLELLSQSLLSPLSPCYFTPISSVVFLVFVLLYSPCISAIGAIKSEFGTKMAFFVFFMQLLVSFVICFIIYNIMLNPMLAILFLGVLILAIVTSFVLKLVHKRKGCWGNCNACGKICSDKKSKSVGTSL